MDSIEAGGIIEDLDEMKCHSTSFNRCMIIKYVEVL